MRIICLTNSKLGGILMKYDFETVVSRRNVGSSKWNLMSKLKSDISDDIVPFSVADMEFKMPPQIVEGLKKYMDSSIFGYTEATEEYYKAVCSWMERRHNWKINKEWITEFSGEIPC
jgi:cystathionine beta-lyase